MVRRLGLWETWDCSKPEKIRVGVPFGRLGSRGSCVHSVVRTGGTHGFLFGSGPCWAVITYVDVPLALVGVSHLQGLSGGSRQAGLPGVSPLHLSELAPRHRLPRGLLHPMLGLMLFRARCKDRRDPLHGPGITPTPTPAETWEAQEAAPPGGRGPSGPQSLPFEPGGCWLPGVLRKASAPQGWRNQSASEIATPECQVPRFSGPERREQAGGDIFCGPQPLSLRT